MEESVGGLKTSFRKVFTHVKCGGGNVWLPTCRFRLSLGT